MFPIIPSATSIVPVAKQARCTSAETVAIVVEVTGPAGTRRARKVVAVSDLEEVNVSAALLDRLKAAVASYARLEEDDA